ncbi:MAG: tetratricopeptide repeat protein [Candidatus Marinimicrobia bacterium]|mgnify:CR=1 FL=1|jgi:tetratricopeptide (TPR) repeat protein|nr:tetratricopeptide repeat protein [Candidatus Neomarinimicrobiota bacterium]MDP6593181.1 tetratricopeptide repeat protein [Candidatus Neomarinimicrobiota bacterium]|tara:strand:+ start:23811 stop:25325 length:1515 start_codon:yes stop_codon:yes gene_type:complete
MGKCRFTLLHISALLLLSCSSQPIEELTITASSSKAKELFLEARYASQENNGGDAREKYRAALAEDTDFVLAKLYINEQDPIKNRQYRQEAFAAKDRVSDMERSFIQIEENIFEGNSDGRLEAAQKLVADHPNLPEAHLELGWAYNVRRELDQAAASFKQSVEIDRDFYPGWFSLTSQHVGVGNNIELPDEEKDMDLALGYADEMIRIRPDAGYSYQLKGNIYRHASDFEAAKKVYEKGIEVDEESGSSHINTAILVSAHNLMFNGEFEEAHERYSRSISLASNPNGKLNLTIYKMFSYLHQNRFDEAIDLLAETESGIDDMDLSETAALGWKAGLNFQKFLVYGHSQRKKEAFEAVETNIALREKMMVKLDDEITKRDNTAGFASLRAWCNVLFGNYDTAENHLNEAKAILENIKDPTILEGYYGLKGMIALNRGKTDEAVKFFEKVDEANNLYYGYFKALALKGAGEDERSNKIIEGITRWNFSSWHSAIVRNLAKKQLGLS